MPSTTFSAIDGSSVPGGQVVHEKQRRRSLHRNVVDAVVHQVGADGRVQVHLKRNFQLGAHSVDARHQHRVGVFRLVDREQPAKSANLAQHAPGKSLVRQVLDALLGAVGAADVHPGVGVGDRRRAGEGVLATDFFRAFSQSLRGVQCRVPKRQPKAAHCSTFNVEVLDTGRAGFATPTAFQSRARTNTLRPISADAYARSPLRARTNER